VGAVGVVGCSSTNTTDYVIVARIAGSGSGSGGGSNIAAVAGDAVLLGVVEDLGTNGTKALPASTTVTWTMPATVTALAPGSDAANPLPLPGTKPTGVFIDNSATRPDITDDIAGVVFILSAGMGEAFAGTLEVSATVSTDTDKLVTASISVAAMPAGDASRGQQEWAEDCSNCHGATGDGSPVGSDGMYSFDGGTYPFPAPGLNDAAGNLATNTAWSAELCAFSSRSDVGYLGLALRVPMPNWIVDVASVTQQPPTTQELADIYAYLVGETQ
jgi:cytochrome c553